VGVVCFQAEVSAAGLSLVRRSPTECGVSECDREASTLCRPWPTGGCRAIKNTVTLRLCGFKVRFILQLISYVKLFRRRLYPKGNDNFFLFYFLKKFLNFLRSEFSNPANCTIYYCLGKIYVRGIIHKFEIMHLK